MELVSSIAPGKRSHVVIYAANIGSGPTHVDGLEAGEALFPNRYPSQERPIHLRMTWEGKDHDPAYWKTEDTNLKLRFESEIVPLLRDGAHFSIFGFAPMPLLIRLGTHFTDRSRADVYQRRREPDQTWKWAPRHPALSFHLSGPKKIGARPVLLVSLSAQIDRKRVTEVLGDDVSIWEISVPRPHNDVLQTRQHLSAFRAVARTALAEIARQHGINTALSIFPAMPISTCVELGRVRMPKVSMPWHVYDHNPVADRFVKALVIAKGE